MHITHCCGHVHLQKSHSLFATLMETLPWWEPRQQITPQEGAALGHERAAGWGLPPVPQSGVVLAWGDSRPSPEVHLCPASSCGKVCSWLSHCNTLDGALQPPPLEYLEVFQNGSVHLLQVFNK